MPGRPDAPPAPYPPQLEQPVHLTAGELQASLDATMAQHKGGPVWLFAYGSLIWRPECPAVERSRARIHGYHRGLYLWSQIHRGTPDAPGLVLGLDRGGSCSGFAYRLPDEHLKRHLLALWQREMPDAAYQPRWLDCRLEDGRRVQALGFVLRRNFACYAGPCRITSSPTSSPVPVAITAPRATTSSRPSTACAPTPCPTAAWSPPSCAAASNLTSISTDYRYTQKYIAIGKALG